MIKDLAGKMAIPAPLMVPVQAFSATIQIYKAQLMPSRS
jgi:hypothetical protein